VVVDAEVEEELGRPLLGMVGVVRSRRHLTGPTLFLDAAIPCTGLKKVRLEMLWACLTYNLQHWIRLNKLRTTTAIT
jgi:hypothetical protein